MKVRKEQLAENVTLYGGDCREVLPTLKRPAAIISDPPYGMKADTDSHRFSGGSVGHRQRRKEGRTWAPVIGDDVEFDPAHLLSTAPIVLLWGLNHFPRGLDAGTALVWLKRSDAALGSFLSDGEIAWLNRGRGVYGFRDFSGHAEASRGERYHPTQKPVALMEWCIERAKVPAGGVICDPYMGAGSTGVAAVRAGYGFVGIEMEPLYFDTACRRIADELRRPRLFAEPVAKPMQQALFAEEVA